jgi:hypothetical protein
LPKIWDTSITVNRIILKCSCYTRAVWKFRGLTLFWVGTLWRCGDGIFFEVPPLASDALLTTLHPLFQNVLADRWSRPMLFLGFSNHEKGAPKQEISKWSTVCSTFSRSGWSVVKSAALAKGGTSKKRPSSHLHKVPTRSKKVSPRTFQMALVYYHVLVRNRVLFMFNINLIVTPQKFNSWPSEL